MITGRAYDKGSIRFFRVDANNERRWILIGDNHYKGWEPELAKIELGDKVPLNAVLLPPLNPSEIVNVGLNYKGHADECGVDWRKFKAPTFFGRALNSTNSPNGHVVVPSSYDFRGQSLGAPRFDYEVELVVVIGKPCYRISSKEALQYVAGYMVGNDVSERQRQIDVSTQWLSGKSGPTCFPIGPLFVSSEHVSDPQSLNMTMWVNGEQRQHASTADMIFSIAECVSALSMTRVLQPGLLISTGTPKGVVIKGSVEQIVHKWLAPGDVMKLTIGNDEVSLGIQTQLCVEEDEAWLEFFRSGKSLYSRGEQYHSVTLS